MIMTMTTTALAALEATRNPSQEEEALTAEGRAAAEVEEEEEEEEVPTTTLMTVAMTAAALEEVGRGPVPSTDETGGRSAETVASVPTGGGPPDQSTARTGGP